MFDRRELAAGILIAAIFLSVFAVAARADEGPAEDPADLTARALAWVDRRSDAAFRFDAKVSARRGWPGREWVGAELVPAALAASLGAHYPEAWPDAELLLAKSWWESRWRPGEVGRFVTVNGRAVRGSGGELGVMQIKPRVCRRYMQAGEDCADTRVNMRIAATILREHLAACDGRPRFALRFYATGNGCAPPRYAERVVTAWAEQIRTIGGARNAQTVQASDSLPAQAVGGAASVPGTGSTPRRGAL